MSADPRDSVSVEGHVVDGEFCCHRSWASQTVETLHLLVVQALAPGPGADADPQGPMGPCAKPAIPVCPMLDFSASIGYVFETPSLQVDKSRLSSEPKRAVSIGE